MSNQLDDLLRNSDPLKDQDVSSWTASLVDVAVNAAPASPSRWRIPARARRVALSVFVGAGLSVGGYAIADSLTSHTGLHAQPNHYTGDHSEIINVCGRDFPTVIMQYAPTDRPLPAHLTYQEIADALVTQMTDTCTSKEADAARGEAQTARSLQENFEFTADIAWQVAWYKAVERGNTAAADQAILQVDATSRRPVVQLVAEEHGLTGGYSDRTVAAMRHGDTTEVSLPDPATTPWYPDVQ